MTPTYEARKFDCHLYVSVHKVTEWKDGKVAGTKLLGYAFKSRPKKADEVYSSLSTKLTDPKVGGATMVLSPWLEEK